MIYITLPWPPSVNHYWRNVQSRVLISAKGRQYREAIAAQALAERWGRTPDAARLSVQIDAWPPDRRKRDLDNVLKAALDSLTHAGLWQDDSQIDHISIRRMPTIGGMVKVRVVEVGNAAGKASAR